MTQYQKQKEQYATAYEAINKKHNLLSTIRLVVAVIIVFAFYQYFNAKSDLFLYAGLFSVVCFLILMRFHTKLAWKRKLSQYLIDVNDNEIAYLKGETIPFSDGVEFLDTNHSYAFDLDILGQNSLYQNLNRTATHIGKTTLADRLLTPLATRDIIPNQEAVAELANKLDWRQNLAALALMTKDSKDNYSQLMKWTREEPKSFSRPMFALFYIVPTLLIVSVLAYVFRSNMIFINVATIFAFFNLILLVSQAKRIKQSLVDSDNISKVIKQYGLLINKIEQEDFTSDRLTTLKSQLVTDSTSAGKELKVLAKLFKQCESIQNGAVAIIFNSLYLHHIHAMVRLTKWKRQNAKNIKSWLDAVGQFEKLNSLGNFSFNNPEFTFPTIDQDQKLTLETMGHPLLPSNGRVCNNVAFSENTFVILTGSNMSGKSTFLRSVGVNLVLAGTGSAICATRANIHPLSVIVSMRQTDSLNDSESYFFAEVKRLKHIFDHLESEVCFVLLDEILKGTNSEDKRNGTIEVIKKLVSKKAIGIIATHDLEVCEITKDYENVLVNKHFEVELDSGELIFDYKLRDGVCKNKSATFLMKKMGVI
jgi:DNA mismatch repair ATPase MutS